MITVLRAKKIDLALLEAHYGFVTPPKVLQALNRDTIQSKGHSWQEDIYKKPITEVRKSKTSLFTVINEVAIFILIVHLQKHILCVMNSPIPKSFIYLLYWYKGIKFNFIATYVLRRSHGQTVLVTLPCPYDDTIWVELGVTWHTPWAALLACRVCAKVERCSG